MGQNVKHHTLNKITIIFENSEIKANFKKSYNQDDILTT